MARRKLSAAQKQAVSLRMKQYWARKRGEKVQTSAPSANSHRMAVRIIAKVDQGDGLRTVVDQHGINSYGQLVDLLTDYYAGVPLTEVLITVR